MSVSVNNLSVTPFGAAAPVVAAVSFALSAGERALLVGPTGAGKSTLLLALTGVYTQLETATVTGKVAVPATGLLLQNGTDAAVGATVFRDVAFGAESAAVPAQRISALVGQALAEVGLGELDSARVPGTLSGGELQRACLAGLLTLAPKLLLLDEPTSLLDADSAAEVRAAVAEYLGTSGATALIVEHQFEPWLPMVSRLLVMDKRGRLIADGPAESVLKDHAAALRAQGLWLGGAAEIIDHRPTGAGRIDALTGRSGAGKTSRLNAEVAALVAVGETTIGWQPQNPGLSITGQTVLESATAGTSADAATATAWLERLGLGGKEKRNPHELSGGETRRLALATALIAVMTTTGKRRLILDEPTVGQDTQHWRAIVDALLEARAAGVEITVATHDTELLKHVDAIRTVTAEAAPPVAAPKGQPFSPLGLLGASAITLFAAFGFQQLSSALLALGLEAVLLLALALARPTLRRPKLLVPIAVGVASVWFSNWWLSSGHDASAAALVATRAAFFGLPGVLLAAEISVAELGDQLGQTLRLPARPVVAATVAMTRVRRLRDTWDNLILIRKLRGTSRRGFAELASLTLLTLIDATRSAERTAIAMEARGFSNTDSRGKLVARTWAVPARWGRWDLVLSVAAIAAALPGLL